MVTINTGDDKQAVKIRIQKDVVEALAIIAKHRGISFSKICRTILKEYATNVCKELYKEPTDGNNTP